MIVLKSERLNVQISEPNEAPNTTFRFDRAGFVSQVMLDGTHYFCALEPHNLWHPSSGGCGFCSEFQWDVSSEAAVGEKFPKLGVGLLTKFEDDRYWFYKKYACQDFPIESHVNENSAQFVTLAMPCLGYAAEQTKMVCVEGNRMTLEMELKNVGEKPICGYEYCHNFLSLDGMAIGEGYRLALPCVRTLEQGMLKSTLGCDNYRGIPGGLCINGYRKEFATLTFQPEQMQNEPFCWTLSNADAGCMVSGSESFVPSQVSIWCIDHMVSPEVFFPICLDSGQSVRWRRSYQFEKLFQTIRLESGHSGSAEPAQLENTDQAAGNGTAAGNGSGASDTGIDFLALDDLPDRVKKIRL